MSIKLQLPTLTELKPRITVIGVGGAGGNAVNNMIASGLSGVDFVVANTDAQALLTSSAEQRVQLGVHLTEGLGAGAKPEIGEAAAEEALDELRNQMSGSHMVFVACGMGGGTGTGAASVIARIAKEMDILTIGIVTKPFQFEGNRRMRIAEAGIEELKKYVDTLIVIPNQNLFRIASEKTTFAEAFVLADQVLYSGIACIVDLIVREGLINLDFADVKAIMSGMGSAMMGTGEGEGERRAIIAAEEAISNPLLDGLTLKGARGLLLSIVGGSDLTLYEVDEAASRIRQEVDPDANIIVGASFDESLDDRVRVSIVASGMEDAAGDEEIPGAQQPAALPPPLPAAASGAEPPPTDDLTSSSGSQIETDAAGRSQAASAFAGSPAARQDSGDEYSRLLMQDAPKAGQTHARHSQPPRSLSDAARRAGGETTAAAAGGPEGRGSFGAQTWAAPGDVTVEPALPQLTATSKAMPSEPGQPVPARSMPWQDPRQMAAAGPAPSAAAATPARQPAPSFAPAPPEELGRRTPRIPTVDEFPTVGQRDYHAKTAPAAPQSGQPRQQQAAAPVRKMGFFERLTGRRGQAGASSTPTDSPSTASADYPQDRKSRGGATGVGAAARRSGGRTRTTDDPKRNKEDIDLPMFFNNSKR